MSHSVSIVEARRELGRLAEQVRRTGKPILLTRRGRPVACLAPHPAGRAGDADPLAILRGTVQMNCGFDELQAEVRKLRAEFSTSVRRRANRSRGKGHRSGG